MFRAEFALVLGIKELLVGLFVGEVPAGVVELLVEAGDGSICLVELFFGLAFLLFCLGAGFFEVVESPVAVLLQVGYGLGRALEGGDAGAAGFAVFNYGYVGLELGAEGGGLGIAESALWAIVKILRFAQDDRGGLRCDDCWRRYGGSGGMCFAGFCPICFF